MCTFKADAWWSAGLTRFLQIPARLDRTPRETVGEIYTAFAVSPAIA